MNAKGDDAQGGGHEPGPAGDQRPAGADWQAAWRGFRDMPLVPAIILMSALAGFGGLAREHGFTLGETAYISASVFALPGQVVLVEQLGRGASLWAAALAVTLTAVRLMPMAVVLTPYLRGSRLPRWTVYFASHFVAITLWVEGLRLLPPVRPEDRLAYFLGMSIPYFLLCIGASALGYILAGELPVWLGAALLFLTPIYFVLSLVVSARGSRGDEWAVGLGVILGPVLFALMPGPDLLITGLVGGTLAYLIGRRSRRT